MLREYFYQGTVHVANTPEGIRQGVLEMKENYPTYQAGIVALRRETPPRLGEARLKSCLIWSRAHSATAREITRSVRHLIQGGRSTMKSVVYSVQTESSLLPHSLLILHAVPTQPTLSASGSRLHQTPRCTYTIPTDVDIVDGQVTMPR